MNDPDAAPLWFTRAIAHSPDVTAVTLEGAAIELLTWGECNQPGLLFVHGMLAHAHWWRFVAPFFAKDYRCAALSLSGMGKSGWRELYPMQRFLADIDGAIAAADLASNGRKPIIVAHSFGGIVARRYAEMFGDRIAGLVLVESPVRPGSRFKSPPVNSTLRMFMSRAEAVQRFSLRPNQTCENPYLIDFVAGESVRRSNQGWSWSFDPNISAKLDSEGYDRDIGEIGKPVAFVWGENSTICVPDMRAEVDARFPASIRVTIPNSGHHVMLDQPIALIAAIRAILSALGANEDRGGILD